MTMKQVLGIDIGGTTIKCASVDEKGNMSNPFVLPVKSIKTQNEVANRLCALINENVPEDIRQIGIGCPGSIDSARGVCCYSNNLDWHDFPLARIISERCNRKVRMINDANAAMLGEVNFGAAKGHKDVVLITLGTGVGSGLFLNGQLYEGNQGGGVELGHAVVVIDGKPCTCGRKGCFEVYASVTGLIKQTQQAMQDNPNSAMWKIVGGELARVNGKTVFDGAEQGDKTAQRVLKEYIHYLGEGILNYINIFRPEVLVIGGGLSGQQKALTDPLNEYVKHENGGFGGPYYPPCPVIVSTLGNAAGVVGAACQFLFEDQIA